MVATPFEQSFQIMVVVFVQAPNGDQLLRVSQLVGDITLFRANPGLKGQPAVGPQLSLTPFFQRVNVMAAILRGSGIANECRSTVILSFALG
jgi:hypothetical protein